MGAIRMRGQTAEKDIMVIHTTPVHQLKSYKIKKLHVCNNMSVLDKFRL